MENAYNLFCSFFNIKIVYACILQTFKKHYIFQCIPHCHIESNFLSLVEIHKVSGDLPRYAEVDHPVHHVEADEQDREDHPAVLVNVTASHAEYS
jgi:hypothetical protein